MAKFGQPGAPSRGPGGRPKKDRTIEELAKAMTPDALEALGEALKTKGERVQAATVILAYGYGKPRQDIDITHDFDFSSLTDEELAAELAAARAASSQAGGGDEEAQGPIGPDGMVH